MDIDENDGKMHTAAIISVSNSGSVFIDYVARGRWAKVKGSVLAEISVRDEECQVTMQTCANGPCACCSI